MLKWVTFSCIGPPSHLVLKFAVLSEEMSEYFHNFGPEVLTLPKHLCFEECTLCESWADFNC